MFHTTPLGNRRWMALTAGLVLALVLTACGSAASPTPIANTAASMSTAGAVSTLPSVSTAQSPSGPLRCAVTPDASPSATIGVTSDSFGFFDYADPVTIKPGQAVVFTNGNGARHTIAEGTYGEAATDASVDVTLANDTSVIVTFYQPGTYQITCRPHKVMQTSVTVQ